MAASFEALRAAGKDRAVEIRALQLISYNMPFFTRHLVKGGPDFWVLLREALLDLVRRVSREEFVHSVGAQDKVLVELIAADRRDAAVEYIENWGSDARRFPTEATPEGIRVELPLTEGLPDDVNIVSDGQLELVSRLMRAVWDDAELRLSRVVLHPQHRPRGEPALDPARAGLGRRGDAHPDRDRAVRRAPARHPRGSTGTATTAPEAGEPASPPTSSRPTSTRTGRSRSR